MSFSEAVPDDVIILCRESFPCFNQDRVHLVMLKPCGIILRHPLSLQNVIESLNFGVRPVFIGLVVDGVTIFKYEGMDVFSLNLC